MTKTLADIFNDEDTSDASQSETWNFSLPENVMFKVERNPISDEVGSYYRKWKDWSLEDATVIENPANECDGGAATYERSYGNGLDYLIMDLVDPPGTGWFVLEGVTATFTRGGPMLEDDRMDFEYVAVRPATDEEIALYV